MAQYKNPKMTIGTCTLRQNCLYLGTPRRARTPFGRGLLWFGLLIHSNSPLRPAAVDREGGQSARC